MELAQTIVPDLTLRQDPTWVVVQSEWNGWRTAMVALEDLKDVHWLQPHGAPRALIHAYVSCTKLQPGNLEHACELRTAPHRLLVCVLRSHTAPHVFDELARQASAGSTMPPAAQS